jgi:hypothetical protein
MIGFTANNDTNCNKAIILLRFGGHGNRARNFERTRNGDNLNLMPLGFQCGFSAGDQHIVQMVVEPRFNY